MDISNKKSVEDSRFYINRDYSQLQFNIRVLEQALDKSYPLLERLNFLLIFSQNLDEFFEIRIANLKQQIALSRYKAGADGVLPHQSLTILHAIVHEQVDRQYKILNEILLPELATYNIKFINRRYWKIQLTEWVKNFFKNKISPIITPIGLDKTHPFPLLVNKSLHFIVELEGMDAFGRDSGLAIIPAPRLFPRIIKIPKCIESDGDNYVFLSSMINANADSLFPGMKVKGCYQFRLTRNADLSVDTEDVEDLARALRGELFSRRYGDAVRLEVVNACPQHIYTYLLNKCELSYSELYKVNGPVNLTMLFSITTLSNHPALKSVTFTPSIPKLLKNNTENIFNVLRKIDVLLLHPFESFKPVIDLLRKAAKDPNVLAIKQTLYRIGTNSEIVDALVEAAKNGKEVTVVIELRARFDEEENLQLASRLQKAGVIVIYGVVLFKTHTKIFLIIRREDHNLYRYYAHLGTGNYHSEHAMLYTDYSFLTSDEILCEDLHKLFSQLIGMGKTLRMKKLLHSPFTLKQNLLDMINSEAYQAACGKTSHIIAKINALTDQKIISALYKASQAGVKIELIIRGMCCLRPGIAGLSNNITVRSIIGRFLEHSRIYYFYNSGDEKVYLSSADLMERNLDSRIETCFPVDRQELITRLKHDLELYLSDNTQSWMLNSDGTYTRINKPKTKICNAQNILLTTLSGKVKSI